MPCRSTSWARPLSATPESAVLPTRPAARPPACAPVGARVTGQGSSGTGSARPPLGARADVNSEAHRAEVDEVHD
eukprot:9060413-Pyramimonas_sp.AAC.1